MSDPARREVVGASLEGALVGQTAQVPFVEQIREGAHGTILPHSSARNDPGAPGAPNSLGTPDDGH